MTSPIVEAGTSFFDRARKAIVAAGTAAVATFGTSIAALASAHDLSGGDYVKAAVAAVAAALAGLGVTYAAPANKP